MDFNNNLVAGLVDKKAMTLDDKRRRRLERNRESARECRKRKREKMSLLRQQISRLEAENFQIRLNLQVCPETAQGRGEKVEEITHRIQTMVAEGSSDVDLLKSINELQERYSDYGRDRRSTIDFHIMQLKRCLRPSSTTRTILWLVSCAPLFHERDGSTKEPRPTGDLANLWFDLLDTLKPTPTQMKALIDMALSTSTSIESYRQEPQNAAPEGTVSGDPIATSSAEKQSEAMLCRLEELITNKNESLDHEMSQVQSLLSANQIAKYIIWIQENPACMQMLEALWPHTTKQYDKGRESDESAHSASESDD